MKRGRWVLRTPKELYRWAEWRIEHSIWTMAPDREELDAKKHPTALRAARQALRKASLEFPLPAVARTTRFGLIAKKVVREAIFATRPYT